MSKNARRFKITGSSTRNLEVIQDQLSVDDVSKCSHRAGKQKYCTPTHSLVMREQLKPKNHNQALYLEALRTRAVIIGSGVAGCGKTYIAVGAALQALLNGEVQKIVVTRPIVQAGEDLGFLPGTQDEKVAPYMLPIVDAIEAFVGVQGCKHLMESGKVEVAPLAYMRGRTFKDAFVILDEAQNTTCTQMKMFITRMGMNCVYVVNGDPAQVDLPRNTPSGLAWLVKKLKDKDPNFEVVEFLRSDTVRSPIMAKLVKLLEAPDEPTTPEPPGYLGMRNEVTITGRLRTSQDCNKYFLNLQAWIP